MEKRLPIVTQKTAVVTECWTFARMAIIQTSTFAVDWLASHMNLFMTETSHIYFGENFRQFRPSYYEDILDTEHIDIFSVDRKDVIAKIKQQIDSNKYVLLSTVWYFDENNVPLIHESLIYGYSDEKKMFYITMLKDRAFIETTMLFSWIEDNFEIVKNHWCSRGGRHMVNYCINFMTPWVNYSLKKTYDTHNAVYMALDKIDKERCGRKIMASSLSEKMTIADTVVYYTGIACLDGLSNAINRICQNLPGYYDIIKIIKVLLEHRKLILLSMRYVKEKLSLKKEFDNIILNYEDCCGYIEKWCNMAIKYDLTKDKTLLLRINCEIAQIYLKEKNSINVFYNNCIQEIEKSSNQIKQKT